MSNDVIQIQQAAQAVQSTWNAWHLIAFGAGAAIIHGYHAIVNAGGVVTIAKSFWRGRGPSVESREPSPAPASIVNRQS